MAGWNICSYIQENLGLTATTVLSTSAVLYYLMNKSKRETSYPISLDNQSIETEVCLLYL